MRKVVAAIVLGIAMSSFAFAQDTNENSAQGPRHHQRGQRDVSPEERAERIVGRLTEKLELTEAQQAEIKAFHLEQMKEGKAQMDKVETREERHEIRKAHREQMDEKMGSLLTEAQMLKYNEMKETRKEKRGEMKRQRRGKSRNH